MHISYDKTATLRSQTKHHEPIVLVYESHNQDSRYNPLGDICETVSAKYGTGGGNAPIVVKRERMDDNLERGDAMTSVVRRLTPLE